MTVLIAAGGTGGHLYPGITLARAFLSEVPAARVVFVGTATGMEARLLPAAGFEFVAIRSGAWVGKGWMDRIVAFGLVGLGFFQAIGLLRRLAPNVVIGIGGYASGPTLIAAILLGIRRMILEPNLVPGLANRKLAPYMDAVVVAFEATGRTMKSRRIFGLGTPVRPEIVAAQHPARRAGRLTLLVLGGSQGAHAINRGMLEALPWLNRDRIRILHQTGSSDQRMVATAYAEAGFDARALPYISEMAAAYAEADLVLSRAGAGTLSEIAAVGLPALLIPYPHAEAHQEKNANVFVEAGAAEVIRDGEVTGQRLAARIDALITDTARREAMATAAAGLGRPNAARDIVQLCRSLATHGGKD